jgi:adenosylcobinamide-GDP ribazoletransferase
MQARSLPAAALRASAAATSFLSRVPLGRVVAFDAADVGRGAMLFPLVGTAVGTAVGLTAISLHVWLTPVIAAALAVAVEAVLTGALHLDALADTADGFGGRSREHALEIMRDARTGVYGATALVLDLLVKTAALAALLPHPRAVLTVIAAWTVGRAAPLVLGVALPYARPGAGTGRALTDHAGPTSALIGASVAAAIAFAAMGVWAAAMIAALALVVLCLGLSSWQRLGGVTGDVLGAATELTTTLALVTGVAAL